MPTIIKYKQTDQGFLVVVVTYFALGTFSAALQVYDGNTLYLQEVYSTEKGAINAFNTYKD